MTASPVHVAGDPAGVYDTVMIRRRKSLPLQCGGPERTLTRWHVLAFVAVFGALVLVSSVLAAQPGLH